MFARITRVLNPAYKQTRKFRDESEYMQDIMLRHTTRACEYNSFSALRVKMCGDIVHGSVLDPGIRLLCFVRTHPGGTEAVEVADEWTRFPDTILAELREKLETVFGIELGVVH